MADGKHVHCQRHLNRRDQKQGHLELEDKMHLVVEEWGPEEGEQRPE